MAKLSKRWFHPIFTVLVATMMSGVVTFVITAVNFGFSPEFLQRWLKSYGVGFGVAVPAVYVLAPLARKLASAIVET